MLKTCRFIARYMAALTLLGAILAFFAPSLFTPFGALFKELFATTMFALGIVLDRKELLLTLKKPVRLGLGLLTQFTVMPLLAFGLVSLIGLPPSIALGFIIVGSAPGAMASNVIVYLAGGALAFSITLTTLATFLSPIMTPFLIAQLGGQFIDIDPWKLVWTINYILVIPLAGGMLLRRYLDKGLEMRFLVNHITGSLIVLSILFNQADLLPWQNGLCTVFILILPIAAAFVPRSQTEPVLFWAKELAPAIAALAIIVICAYAVAKNQAQIQQVGAAVFMAVVVLNILGYVAGWFLAKLYRFDASHRLTLAIEIGMQNAGMGVALALAHFADQPEVALPGALFAVWCIITAAGASSYFRYKSSLVKPAAHPH